MNKTKLLTLTSLSLLLVSGLFIKKPEATTYNYGKNAFEDTVRKYTGLTTYTYKYFETAVSEMSNSSNLHSVAIDESKSKTITEEQDLYYWLHIPFDYQDNPNKDYPILVFCSGSGCTMFEHEDFATKESISKESDDFINSPYSSKYRQSVRYADTFWICNYIDINGNWIYEDKMGGYDHYGTNSASGGGAFIDKWYDLVVNQGHSEYDCFILYIQPIDEDQWENKANLEALTIQTMPQASNILDATVKGTSAYKPSYVASEMSPSITSQLTNQLIDQMIGQYRIDASRQYIAGYSLGAIFAEDTISHYPERYACALTSCLPSSDSTVNNVKNLTNMNIWAIHGANDGNCSKLMSKDFIDAINEAKETYGGTGEARYSYCNGGHSGNYLSCGVDETEGYNIDTTGEQNAICEFMFNSVNSSIDKNKYKKEMQEINKSKFDYKISLNNDETYNLLLIGASRIINEEQGFVVNVNDSSLNVGNKTKMIKVDTLSGSYKSNINNQEIIINAYDYNCPYVYCYQINNIPTSINKLNLQTYVKNSNDYIYGSSNNYSLKINGTKILLEEVN